LFAVPLNRFARPLGKARFDTFEGVADYLRMTTTAVWIALTICVIQIVNSWVLKWYEIRNKETKDNDKNQAAVTTDNKKSADEKYIPFKFRFYHVLLSWVVLSVSAYTLTWLLYFHTVCTVSDAFTISLCLANIWFNINTIFIEPFTDKRFNNLWEWVKIIFDFLKRQIAFNNQLQKRVEELERQLEKRSKKKLPPSAKSVLSTSDKTDNQ
jgi:hypothetical protein